MTKLSLDQIENSYELVEYDDWCEEANEPLPSLDKEIDESCYRNTYQRKEIRTKRKREDGELVGKGNIHKHRKY